MLTSFASYFATRQTSIKGQKLVSEVVKHHPDQNGLVQIRTRNIHDDWPEAALPWVQMKGGYGSGNNQGTTDTTKQIPPVGSKVYSQFEDDSQYHGVYFGGPASDDKKIPEFTGENYGHTYGQADPGGHLVVTNTKEGSESYSRTHPTGTTHGMDKDGGYNVNAAKKVSMGGEEGMFKFDKDGALEFGGDLVIRAGGKVTFEGKSMEFKHGGATSTTPITLGGGGPSAPSSRTKPVKRGRPKYKTPGMSV